MTGPRGGDAVRLAARWDWGDFAVKPGEIGTADGLVQCDSETFSIIFNASSFRDDHTCSSSGGPGTVWTPVGELHPSPQDEVLGQAGKMVKRWFWKWNQHGPGAGNGVPYQLEVPLWDWIPVKGEPTQAPAAERGGMRYLLPKLIPGMPAAQFGLMVTPHMPVAREALADYDWAADNQVFTGHFEPGKFFTWLHTLLAYRERCLFVTVPDLVADCDGTLLRWYTYRRRIHNLGFPTAFVCQDGQEPYSLPTDQDFTDWCDGRDELDDWSYLLAGRQWVEECIECDWLFIGGTTKWKLGPEAAALIKFGRRLGKGIHIGRVNGGERFRAFQVLGADTCDGTSVCFAPDANYKKIESWTRQPALLTV